MSSRSARKSKSVASKAVELAVAVPQVVAHRVARMAISGPTLSDRDRKEFELMVAEKKVTLRCAHNPGVLIHANAECRSDHGDAPGVRRSLEST